MAPQMRHLIESVNSMLSIRRIAQSRVGLSAWRVLLFPLCVSGSTQCISDPSTNEMLSSYDSWMIELNERGLSQVEIDHVVNERTIALRHEVENRLKAYGEHRIEILDLWRQAIDGFLDQEYEYLAYLSGGGSAYAHGMARNNYEIERFLAEHALSLTDLIKDPVQVDLSAEHPLVKRWNDAMWQNYKSFTFNPDHPDEAWKNGWTQAGVEERFPFENKALVELFDRLDSVEQKDKVLEFLFG